MRILLRQTQTGRYYAKGRHWVNEASRAMDLKRVQCANQLASHQNFQGVEIILEYGQPLGNLVMPLWHARHDVGVRRRV